MDRREAIAALVGLPAVSRISRTADLKPDDVIVVECEYEVSPVVARQIGDTIGEIWPNRKVLVLQKCTMKVVPGVSA